MTQENNKKKVTIPIPENESDRLSALRGYAILDTLPEKQFDDITRLASLICETPITLISLLDESRQWFKSSLGLEVTETPREFSFCQFSIMQDDIFEVSNSHEDERFSNNPYVLGDPHISFYAGAPLITPEGHKMGTLCVIDSVPKKLTDAQREALKILANEVVINLELRKERAKLEEERKHALDAQELLLAFLDNAPSFATLRDKDQRYLLADKKSLANMNKTAEVAVGMHIRDVAQPDIVERLIEDDKRILSTLKPEVKDYEIPDKDGTRHYQRHLFPVFDADHNVYGVGTVTNDITDQKLLERQIRLTSERFQSIFFNSPISISISDLKTSTFLMVNQTFCDIFGYKPEDVEGKHVDEFDLVVHEEQRLSLRQEIEQMGRVYNKEVHVRGKDGYIFIALVSVEIVKTEDSIQAISAFQDITERFRMQEQLTIAKQEAEASTMAKSSFLANMSHEIRTPLNAMLGFASLLLGTQLDKNQREYLEAIDTSGKNLLSIINDILDFSKIEAGMFTIEKTPFSLQQALHSVNTMFFEKAQAKGLKLFTAVDPKLPPLVNGDPTRFTQILMNLLGNAIKFTNQGTISVEAVVEKITDNGATVRISVTDTGIGISEDKQNVIFKRFTQAEDNTTRNFGGTGLGLSIAKKLVELQGGEIWVKSEVNRGSEFSFRMTYEISDSKEYPMAEEIVKDNNKDIFDGKRVLIVEDNLLNQKLASTLLKAEGFDTKVAENGQIALDILANEQFDLILMDIQMPIMDGYQATAKIRADVSLTIPIVAMTANALTGERERCIGAGMNNYITKPFKTQDLLQIIADLLKK